MYTFSQDAIALAANTAKTVLELKTASTGRARIIEWWVEFDGIVAGRVPVKCEMGRFSAAVTTITTGTPDKYDLGNTRGATSTIGHTATVEGAGTITAGTPIHRISPQGGAWPFWPLGREMIVPVSAFWRMRLTAVDAVNVTAGITWVED